MKNREYYKDKIHEIACTHDIFAISKKTGKMTRCAKTNCGNCLFNSLNKELFPTCNTCSERATAWLEQEHVEPILDAVEKRYLENVIRPFRKQVTRVCKVYGWYENYAHIRIMIKHPFIKNMRTYSNLPLFNVKKMYLGMEPNKEYTLEELGLFESEDK